LTRFPHRVQTDPEGTLWRDPPNYWENIVWPAYVDAHKHIFENGDVERGKSTVIENLVLLEALDISMTEEVELCCQVIHRIAQEAYGAK
jgi:nicotinamide/nicotinate riboside kinase